MKRAARLFASFALAAALVASSPSAAAAARALPVLPGTTQINWLSPSPLVAWLRADLGVSIGTGVVTIADQSGNSHTFGQATGSKQPTVSANDSSWGGATALAFVAASTQSLASSSALTQAVPYTLYFAVQCSGNFQSIGGNGSTIAPGVYQGSDVTVYTGIGAIATSVACVAAPVIIAITVTSTTTTIYVNNSQTANTSATTTGVALAGDFLWGATNAGLGVGTLNGKSPELIIESGTASAARRAQVFGYAGSRYGKAAWH